MTRLILLFALALSARAQTIRGTEFIWGAGSEGTCNALNRGRVVMVQGNSGVADTLQVCQKDSSDAYAWASVLFSGTFGATGGATSSFDLTSVNNPVVTYTMRDDAVAGTVYLPQRGGQISSVLQVSTSTTDTLTAATINVTETVFGTTYTIPANFFLYNGKVLRVTMVFDHTTSATPVTQRFRIRLGGIGGTVIYDGGSAVTPSVSMAGRTVQFTCFIQGTAAPGASVAVETGIIPTSGPTTGFNGGNTIAQGVAVATNAALEFTPTLQFGGNTAGNTVTLRQMIVEQLN